MKKYIVDIKDAGKIFKVKNRLLRSPVNFEINENELKSVKMKIKIDGILNYSIEEFVDHIEDPIIKKYEYKKSKKLKFEI